MDGSENKGSKYHHGELESACDGYGVVQLQGVMFESRYGGLKVKLFMDYGINGVD